MKPNDKTDPYSLDESAPSEQTASPRPTPTDQRPGMDLEAPTDAEAARAPVAPRKPAAPPRPGMDLEAPIEPAEARPPIEPGKPAVPSKPGMDLEAPIAPQEVRAPMKPGKPPASSKPTPGPSQQAAPSTAAPATPAATATGRFTDDMQAGVHVISLSRRDVLDAEYIRQVGDDIYRHLRKQPKPKVVMDLQSVQFMSSSALGMLIALRGAVVDKMSGVICIANVSDDLKEVFRITKLHKMMKIHANTDKAIKSLL